MARFSVYLPDELYHRALAELPEELSWSSVLAEGLRHRLGCAHEETRVVCTSCGAPMDGHEGAHLDGDDEGMHPPGQER